MLIDGVPAKHPRRTLTMVRESWWGRQKKKGLIIKPIDPTGCKDASKSCQQAFIRKRILYVTHQSVCRRQ
jgi:hypothetical protein